MLRRKELEDLAQSTPPLLTAYMETGPVEAPLHGRRRAYSAWLQDESRPIIENISPDDQEQFRKQLDRVRAFLERRIPHERSLVIFAGPKIWRIIPLEIDVEPALHWGKPALAQLVSLAAQHKLYGLIAVDHAGVRFLEYLSGEIIEVQAKKFAIDTSGWKKKELGHVTGQGVSKSRGSQRDLFERRMENRYARLCRETAQQAVRFGAKRDWAAMFLIGPDQLIQQIYARIPDSFARPIVLFDQDLARVTTNELKNHVEPQILAWERKRQTELVKQVTSAERGAVEGFDETLAQMQKGHIRTLVLVRGLDADLHQCATCGWTDRSADPLCPLCGSERVKTTLWDVLPELARRHDFHIEVVSAEAADGLKKAGGMAGWLRQRKALSARSGR